MQAGPGAAPAPPAPEAVPTLNGFHDEGLGDDHDAEEKDGPVQETDPPPEALIASQVDQHQVEMPQFWQPQF